MRNVTRGVVLGAIVLMVIGGSVPASAKAPTKEVLVDKDMLTIDFTGVDGCEGFTEVMDSERVTITTYFDKAGTVKEVWQGNFFGTIKNADGETFRDHASFHEVYGPDGSDTVSGSSYHYVVAGQGQVFAEVGHKILLDEEVVTQAGQDDYVQLGLEEICEALS